MSQHYTAIWRLTTDQRCLLPTRRLSMAYFSRHLMTAYARQLKGPIRKYNLVGYRRH